MISPALALAVATAVAVGGCKRGATDAPPCAAVGAKFLLLARDGLVKSTLSDELRRGAHEALPAMRDSIVAACTDAKWSGPVRACLVAANDHLAFEACEQQLTDAQRADLDRASRGEPRAARE